LACAGEVINMAAGCPIRKPDQNKGNAMEEGVGMIACVVSDADMSV